MTRRALTVVGAAVRAAAGTETIAGDHGYSAVRRWSPAFRTFPGADEPVEKGRRFSV